MVICIFYVSMFMFVFLLKKSHKALTRLQKREKTRWNTVLYFLLTPHPFNHVKPLSEKSVFRLLKFYFLNEIFDD